MSVLTVEEVVKGMGYVPNPNYQGEVMTDDILVAINIWGTKKVVNDYAVVQIGVTGIEKSLNPETSDKTYLRQGKSSTKTATQKTMAITSDLYAGDDVQDFVLSPQVKYGSGSDVVVDYVEFNLRTGRGETGKMSIFVNSDGGGEAGTNATISYDLKKTGKNPKPYLYKPKAPIGAVSGIVKGQTNEALSGQTLKVVIAGATFKTIETTEELKTWVTNTELPSDFSLKPSTKIEAGATEAVLNVNGTFTDENSEEIKITIPQEKLQGTESPLTIEPTQAARFNIATMVLAVFDKTAGI